MSQPATLNTSCPSMTSVVSCVLTRIWQCTVIRSTCCPSSTMVISPRLMPRTVSVVLAAVLKTMSVGAVSTRHSLAMVLPMITGTHPVSARTHSGKYPSMENCLWLISINGEYMPGPTWYVRLAHCAPLAPDWRERGRRLPWKCLRETQLLRPAVVIGRP